jgi:hypothetical protein
LDFANTLVSESVPPASFNTNLAPLIEGPMISLAPKHAKVRREGYRR